MREPRSKGDGSNSRRPALHVRAKDRDGWEDVSEKGGKRGLTTTDFWIWEVIRFGEG